MQFIGPCYMQQTVDILLYFEMVTASHFWSSLLSPCVIQMIRDCV
jgi:hypothetical protein